MNEDDYLLHDQWTLGHQELDEIITEYATKGVFLRCSSQQLSHKYY